MLSSAMLPVSARLQPVAFNPSRLLAGGRDNFVRLMFDFGWRAAWACPAWAEPDRMWPACSNFELDVATAKMLLLTLALVGWPEAPKSTCA
jgi:hypothetical protein